MIGDSETSRLITIPEQDFNAIAKALKLSDIPKGCAIDFGYLQTGELALVENNAGFSIGAYIEPTKENIKNYFDVLWAYWQDLVSKA